MNYLLLDFQHLLTPTCPSGMSFSPNLILPHPERSHSSKSEIKCYLLQEASSDPSSRDHSSNKYAHYIVLILNDHTLPYTLKTQRE